MSVHVTVNQANLAPIEHHITFDGDSTAAIDSMGTTIAVEAHPTAILCSHVKF